MGKTIRLTEEQIRRFFGEGFGKTILGEGRRKKEPEKTELSLSGKYSPNANIKSKNDPFSGEENPAPASHTGFHQIERGGRSKDYPGAHGAWVKMHDFGNIRLGNDKTGVFDVDTIIEQMYKLNNGKALNVIDAVKIIQGLKSGTMAPQGEVSEEEIKGLLNTLNIQTIFANYLNLRNGKYVYTRLMQLTPEEIETIEKEYGRNFEGWGTKCDACGVQVWKTTIMRNEHDDAHINMEYMGAGGKEKGASGGMAVVNESARQFKTYSLNFEIHHMNEVAGDNNPLNLACLCPNCHSLAGSTNMNKRGLTQEQFNFLETEGLKNKDGSIMGEMSEDEQNEMIKDLKYGYFDAQVSDDFIAQEAEICGIDIASLEQAAENICGLLEEKVGRTVSIKEGAMKPSGEEGEQIDLQEVGIVPIRTKDGKLYKIVVGSNYKNNWLGVKLFLYGDKNRRSDYRALSSNMLTTNYFFGGNEQMKNEFKKNLELEILNLFKKRYDTLDWAANGKNAEDNIVKTGGDLNISAVKRASSGGEELQPGDVPTRNFKTFDALSDTGRSGEWYPFGDTHGEYKQQSTQRKIKNKERVEIGGTVFPTGISQGTIKKAISDDELVIPIKIDADCGWNTDNAEALRNLLLDNGITDMPSAIEFLTNSGFTIKGAPGRKKSE